MSSSTTAPTPAPLCVIAGPTASGKSALAIELARRWKAEIINADSQQVYRHFDIGTAKPPPEMLEEVPHHLISMIEPQEQFTAAKFQVLADAAIADIHARGKRAIVVGGTGLYLRVLLHGVMPAPAAQPELRARLESEAAAEGGREALHQRLAEVDPETARLLPKQDVLRVIRALEIWEASGVPFSEHRKAHAFAQERHPYELWVLSPPREALYRGINARTEQMFRGGLIEEVRALVKDGYEDAPPMGSVGYVQALAVVQGRMTLDEAIADTAQQTRRYAKRQMTWFKRERGARFITPPYAELREKLL